MSHIRVSAYFWKIISSSQLLHGILPTKLLNTLKSSPLNQQMLNLTSQDPQNRFTNLNPLNCTAVTIELLLLRDLWLQSKYGSVLRSKEGDLPSLLNISTSQTKSRDAKIINVLHGRIALNLFRKMKREYLDQQTNSTEQETTHLKGAECMSVMFGSIKQTAADVTNPL